MKTHFLKLMAIGLAAGICLSAATGCAKKSNSTSTTTQSMSTGSSNGGTCPAKKEGAPACPKAKPKPAPTCPKAPSKNGCSSQQEKSASSRKLGAAGRVVHGNH